MAAQMTGEEVIQVIAARTDTVLLAFSGGKDCIGAWLAIRKHFRRIIPYYMYLVPGLEFVERGLRGLEAEMGIKVIRIPHPSLYRMINACVFQPPERSELIGRLALPEPTYSEMQQAIRDDLGLGDECYTATGVRAADSPVRLMSIRQHGAINHNARQFMPIWDWKKARLVDELRQFGIRLPEEYRIFGRSFDGVDYRFLEPISREYPRDYQRILKWFPLADLEIERRRYVGAD
jgi:3'-phosphoadenosine 5'-phosphosulfate sulfotransferase (PAPS reductase)/FAD synthetase